MNATMDGKTVLITGASNGIGLEAASAIAAMGATVVMVARDRARGEAAVSRVRNDTGSERVELMLADLASMSEIRNLAKDFTARHDALHVLVNNAGAHNAARTLTTDGFETTFGVNHLAYFLLAELLLDTLKASAPARIVNVSSGAHHRAKMNFDDLMGERGYRGFSAYGQSKLANVLHAYELARRLDGTGVTSNALHPGVVATGFGKNNAGLWGTLFGIGQIVAKPIYLSPARGAETTVYLATSPDVEGVTGKYFQKRQPVPSNPASYDVTAQDRLRDISAHLTGVPVI
jgi:NAD(P)-dependent dehydrogenase (short-subunit alcohol dehydrogenase family)